MRGVGETVAVVDREGPRRERAVAALAEAGFSVDGSASLAERTSPRVPSLIVIRPEDRGQLDAELAALASDRRIVSTPVVVLGVGVSIEDAFERGATDHVADDQALEELAVRVIARLRRPVSAAPPSPERKSVDLLLELTQRLSSTIELREILFLVVKRVAEVVGSARASIVLGGSDDNTAFVIAASDDEELRDLPISLEDYPEIKRCLDTGQPFVVDDATTHPLFELTQVTIPPRFRALALFPILFEDRAMGVLFLRFEDTAALGPDDWFAVRAVANATGIALRNASLLHSLRDQSRRSRSAHVEAEKQLRALQRYVDFFDSTADGIMVVGEADLILFCNPAAGAIFGRPRDTLVGEAFPALLAPESRHDLAALRASFADGVFPHNVDLTAEVDGEARTLNVSFSSVLHEHDGVIVSLRDVTEDRALAHELKRTTEFLEHVIDSSVDAIVSVDMRGRVVLFNHAAEEIYGYAADEVVGQMHVTQLYPKGLAREIMARIRSDEQGGSGTLRGFETVLLGKDGREIPVMLSASLLMEHGQPIGSVGIFKDLRAMQQVEQRLESAKLALAEREQKAFIAELAGATAHELNQPLTAVMGYANMLEKALASLESQLVPSPDSTPSSQDEPTPSSRTVGATEQGGGGVRRSTALEWERLYRASGAIMRQTERMAEIVRKIGKLTRFESKAYVGDTKIIDIERSMASEPPESRG
ncbi:MAG: PAS domain S-box protein [Myxococcales bacterium]|nr:PAS domain S-box protein [Myxococcales bacterium]